MARQAYVPAPESYAGMAVDLLRGFSGETEVTGIYLAKRFGIAPSSIPGLFRTAVREEYLTTRKDGEGMLMFGLGRKGLAMAAAVVAPPVAPTEETPFHVVEEEDLVTQRRVDAVDAPAPVTTGVPSVFHLAGVLPMPSGQKEAIERELRTSQWTTRMPIVAAPAATPVPGLRCGLFNNGQLMVNGKHGEFTFEPGEVHELLAYLEKISSALEASA